MAPLIRIKIRSWGGTDTVRVWPSAIVVAASRTNATQFLKTFNVKGGTNPTDRLKRITPRAQSSAVSRARSSPMANCSVLRLGAKGTVRYGPAVFSPFSSDARFNESLPAGDEEPKHQARAYQSKHVADQEERIHRIGWQILSSRNLPHETLKRRRLQDVKK